MSYIICFYDKSKLQVADDLAKKLMGAIQSEELKHFTLGDSLYFVGGVEKIVPKEEARKAFPEDWGYFNEMEDAKAGEDFARLSNNKLLS